MMGLVRVDVFPYVTYFCNAFDDIDPELPVVLTFKKSVGIHGISRHIDDGDVRLARW